MENSVNDIINVVVNILLVIGGFGAFIVYRQQKKNEEKVAASLIVLQIEELKDKLVEINTMVVDGMINQTSFYETLDIINDNQWEKYKHLFVKKIDNYSYKIINNFYEYTLGIKEQLTLVKKLQHNQYFNIQEMINTNCNSFLLDRLQREKQDLNLNQPIELQEFIKDYGNKKEKIMKITNFDPYIQYIPQQVSITLSKQLSKVNSLEIIGSNGFKKLKKISRLR